MQRGSFGFVMRKSVLTGTVLCALMMSGCLTRNKGDTTGSIGPQPQMSQPQWRERLPSLAKAYESNPNDRNAIFGYATALRALAQLPQATAILQAAVLRHQNDLELLGLYGRVLADGGQFREAQDVLQRSHLPEKPDWRILSVQGSVSDQLGEHENARQYYETALKIAPGEPSILSNYGLSLALSKQLPQSERVLREAVAHPRADARVRQNLVMTLGLQGKFAEAEQLARQDQSPAEAANTIADLKRMVTQPNSWEMLKNSKSSQGGNKASAQNRSAKATAPKPRSAAIEETAANL